MARSQRHMLVWQNTTMAGEVVAQGEVAPGMLIQAATPPQELIQAQLDAGATALDTSSLTVPVGAPGGPLQGSSLTGAVPAELSPPPGPTPGPEPLPGEEPVLTSLNPTSAVCAAPELTMHAHGSFFTDTSIIYFNSAAVSTTFVSANQLSTTVDPTIAETPFDVPVWVQQGSVQTAPQTFSFTAARHADDPRTIPSGPFTINRIEDHADGLAIALADGDVRVGDTVLIEATGNTSVNGSYEVLAVDGLTIVVDNVIVLDTPIEAKGRLTVNGEA
jgi:hypothetical protein